MSEILNLWSHKPSNNKVLLYNFHPLQKMLNKKKLLDSLEQKTIEWVNLVGLDINKMVRYPYLRSPL